MDPPSRVQSFYHSAMMPIPWLCTLTEEEEDMSGDSCIMEFFGFCKGGNFNIHIWAWFGYFICTKREIRFYLLVKS